jgi:hypothetical protein
VDRAVTACWLALAAIHAFPASVFFHPALSNSLYGVAPDGAVGAIVVHRGGLFLAVMAVASYAAFAPAARRAASLVVGISVASYLMVYLRAGSPAGALRTIALVDAGALLPLAYASWTAWRRKTMLPKAR